VPRVGKGVHGALRVLGVPPDLTVGVDMGGLSHLTSERGEIINGGHERTVSPVGSSILKCPPARQPGLMPAR